VERCTSFETLVVKPELRHPIGHVKSPFLNTLNGGDRSGLPPHTYALSAYNPEEVAASKPSGASLCHSDTVLSQPQMGTQGHEIAA
jgi:hypothetical protein